MVRFLKNKFQNFSFNTFDQRKKVTTLIADIVLVSHFAIVIFITFGFFLIPIGYKSNWAWVKNLKLRICHCGMMTFVTLESLLGITCPLTLFENNLRGVSENTSFISYWIYQIIFWDLPSQFFIILYSVVLTWTFLLWRLFPPIIKKQQLIYSPPKLITKN